MDREALCIVAGQKVSSSLVLGTAVLEALTDFCWKVWSIRVDAHFLDDEGNMLDCASIAAMTALRHFRRPDVTVIGEEVTIASLLVLSRGPRHSLGADLLCLQHSMTERVPVPLAIHHSPFCQTFAFFGEEFVPPFSPTTAKLLTVNNLSLRS